MKCKNCASCYKGYYRSRPNDYVCIGVPEPFIINDIDKECRCYPDKSEKESTCIENETSVMNDSKEQSPQWKFAVTVTYSFSKEIDTYLFETKEEAIEFLHKNYNDILNIYNEDKDCITVSGKLRDGGSRAKISAHKKTCNIKVTLMVSRVTYVL